MPGGYGGGGGGGGGMYGGGAEVKLFIGGVATTASEDDLRSLFEPYRNLVSVNLLRHKDTGASRGCGFVVFSSHDSASSAIMVRGRGRASARAGVLPSSCGRVRVCPAAAGVCVHDCVGFDARACVCMCVARRRVFFCRH
jgi:hypothetical protein